jgi:hypothetical protein
MGEGEERGREWGLKGAYLADAVAEEDEEERHEVVDEVILPHVGVHRRHHQRQLLPDPPVGVDEHGLHVVRQRGAQRGDGRHDRGDFFQDPQPDQRVLVVHEAHDGVPQRTVQRVRPGLGDDVDAYLGEQFPRGEVRVVQEVQRNIQKFRDEGGQRDDPDELRHPAHGVGPHVRFLVLDQPQRGREDFGRDLVGAEDVGVRPKVLGYRQFDPPGRVLDGGFDDGQEFGRGGGGVVGTDHFEGFQVRQQVFRPNEADRRVLVRRERFDHLFWFVGVVWHGGTLSEKCGVGVGGCGWD